MMRILALLGLVFFSGCEGGQGINTTQVDEKESEITPDGVPDRFDNCPQHTNPPTQELGIACMQASDCLLAGNPAILANGEMTPVATNERGSSPVGVWCVQAECVIQPDNDLDGGGDACDEDDDNDRIHDDEDNCELVPNTNQADLDGDGKGDVCDDDDDGDGISDEEDNCPLVANPDQADANRDGEGDACDGDTDGDGIPDADDNCPLNVNADQLDTDGDGLGDACDDDDDNDTVADVSDNCPLNSNANQVDTDMDGAGDACDDDDDDDTVADVSDNCPLVANLDQANLDRDALGDVCDSDADGDGILNVNDNCQLVPNPDQADSDGDELGDACEDDCDGDGVPSAELGVCSADTDGDGFVPPQDCLEGNEDVFPGALEECNGVDDDCDGTVDEGNLCEAGDVCGDGVCAPANQEEPDADNDGIGDDDDNCPAAANANQADSDNDGIGDLCDDSDADGVLDPTDNCTLVANPNQADTDNDGRGDACDAPDDRVQCVADAGCPVGQFCGGGFCAPRVDLHGRTGLGQSGANGGLFPDGTPDNRDDDLDCSCETLPCFSTAVCPQGVFGGDCDDGPTGRFNNPSVPEFPGDNYDNNCDGLVL